MTCRRFEGYPPHVASGLEATYLAAVRLGLWKPEPGAPWKTIPKSHGRPSLEDHNVRLVTEALRKHGPMDRYGVAAAIEKSDSATAKMLSRFAGAGVIGFRKVNTRTGWKRVYHAIQQEAAE